MKTFYHNSIYANKKDTVVHKLEQHYDCLIPENSILVIIKGRVDYVVNYGESEGSTNHTFLLILITLFGTPVGANCHLGNSFSVSFR